MPNTRKRFSVQAARCHLRLIKLAILKTYLFGAGLSGRLFAIGVTMVEDIILTLYLDQTAMGVSGTPTRMIYIRHAGQSDIATADQDPDVLKAPGRTI